mmetsp:Transcript_30993/g.44027  ORF Transcript_30993/g.44027 Transcript_30993/m.44027 type:complete len:88 (-) Transcript_30993:444-707(-)
MMSQNNLINALFTEINIWKLWTYLVFQVNRNGRSMPVGIKEIEEETDDEMCVYNSLNNYNMVVGANARAGGNQIIILNVCIAVILLV